MRQIKHKSTKRSKKCVWISFFKKLYLFIFYWSKFIIKGYGGVWEIKALLLYFKKVTVHEVGFYHQLILLISSWFSPWGDVACVWISKVRNFGIMEENVSNVRRSVRRSNKCRFKFFFFKLQKERRWKVRDVDSLDESLNGVKESDLCNALNWMRRSDTFVSTTNQSTNFQAGNLRIFF
jgi:hypothetical protein